MDTIINRQYDIAAGIAAPLELPRFSTYTICNLRGGIGKTSLAFNLAYLAGDVLAVDTCPQCNLSCFFDNNYAGNNGITAYDMLIPYFVPGLGKTIRGARSAEATNKFFDGHRAYFIQSDSRLYVLPSQITTALMQARATLGEQQAAIIDSMLYSLRDIISNEMRESGTTKCIIDTSPFFSGATHLAWHACDAMIVPVRTDQQSVNSLSLLLRTLSDSHSEFRKMLPTGGHTPKIQMVVLTHGAWSTSAGARNKPSRQTRIYLEKVFDIIRQNITHFTTHDPENHLMVLDDFLGTGRVSSVKSKPIMLLKKGESITENRVKSIVNDAVEKVQAQLSYIHSCLW